MFVCTESEHAREHRRSRNLRLQFILISMQASLCYRWWLTTRLVKYASSEFVRVTNVKITVEIVENVRGDDYVK